MDTKQVIARFEAERQALALMDHPHIARVLDAGSTDSSRPYFVMDLVRGIPITEYCDKQRLNTCDRLKLFLDVCHAVQHAHLKGIIHRDLKPSNVLITLHDGVPVVKVIDFGVAKALNQELTEKTLFTQFSQMVGTPLYMSPEQAELSGLDIDTRSDVYSLGVLLYELLTGTTPFDKDRLKNAGFEEMRRIIREDEPPKPSTRISTLRAADQSTTAGMRGIDPRQLNRLLRGEIDWIVMKALEKDRSRRYESASALAADIQRYLSDEPVLACPPSTMYRFQKFARKHKPALATAAAIAACMILGTTVSAWQAARATTAEAQASANASQAERKANEANTERDETQRQRDEVKTLNEKLQSTQAELRSTLYAAHMNLAQQAWEAPKNARVVELLDRHRPKSGEADLRGFEWHYLNHLCHSDLLTLEGHVGFVHCVAFSPDGKRIASGSAGWNETGKPELKAGRPGVKVFDAKTGKELLDLKGHKSQVISVAFSPDGHYLASATNGLDESYMPGAASELKVWDTESGSEIFTSPGAIDAFAYSPDGKWLAVADHGIWDEATKAYTGGSTRLLDAKSGKQQIVFNDATEVTSLAFSPDGQRMAGARRGRTSEDGAVIPPAIVVWNPDTGRQLEVFTSKGHAPHKVSFSPDGSRLGSASSSAVKIVDSMNGAELVNIKKRGRGIDSIAFSPDGERLAIGSWNEIQMWDARTGDELFDLRGPAAWVTSISFSPDGRKVAAACWQAVQVFDAQRSQESLQLQGHKGYVGGVTFSPDGRVASASADRTIRLWDCQSGLELLSLQGHTGFVLSITFSPDGNYLASASGDGSIKIWNASSGEEVRTLRGHKGGVLTIAFSSDGAQIASGSTDETVKLWDAKTGQAILTLKGHTGGASSLAYSPDGRRLASINRNWEHALVHVWDPHTGEELLSFKPSGGVAATSVAFSPDGSRLATAQFGGSGIVTLWEAQTGREVLKLQGHGDRVNALAFIPDGRRLATGSEDQTIKLWDMQSGEELVTLKGHTAGIRGVAFSADGRRVASASMDRTVRIWDATPLPEKP